MAAKRTIVYDMETCGRCGGSGHYSYNQIHGTVCYGCGGRGKRQTRQAKKALAEIESLRKTFDVPAADLKSGDKIITDVWPKGRMTLTVEAIEPDTLNAGCMMIRTSEISIGTTATTLYRRPLTADQAEQLCALADTLKGVTVKRIVSREVA